MKWLCKSKPIPSVRIECPKCQRTLKVQISHTTTIQQLRLIRDHALLAHRCAAGGNK